MRIRSFQQSDKPAILEISKHTWGGYDHLPFELDGLMADKKSHLFVLVHRNRVVTFANLKVIENGKTGWMEYMRVHPRFRKRGFASTMMQHLLSEATKLGVERIRLTTVTENEATKRIANRIGMHQVFQMKILWKRKFSQLRWKDTSVPIYSCTPNEAFAFLQSKPALLPADIVLNHWHAFDATQASFEAIGHITQFWKSKENRKVGALSFGFLRRVRDGSQWCSTIYALDEPSFHSALSHQFQTANQQKAQYFMCFHPIPYQAAFKIPGLKTNTHEMKLVLFEKQRPFVQRR